MRRINGRMWDDTDCSLQKGRQDGRKEGRKHMQLKVLILYTFKKEKNNTWTPIITAVCGGCYQFFLGPSCNHHMPPYGIHLPALSNSHGKNTQKPP